MRLIPVIDLLDDQAVHAVKGRRNQYRPVQSVLCSTSDPLALATAFRDRLKLHELYIADLNAIQGFSRTHHRSVIQKLCNIEGTRIILDAGTSGVEKAQAWFELGVHRVVIGSETLDELKNLQIPSRVQNNRLVFSLDFKNGKILSRCRDLAAMPPIEVLSQLQLAGWQEVILLDLNRVGSQEGANATLVSDARSRFPDLRLLIGGGVAKLEELAELNSMGVAGVLLATAFHNGAIDARHIAGLATKK
jgi:phosphoribosylformimino-5-aminoimidazole carboxamide ribotide isomerase